MQMPSHRLVSKRVIISLLGIFGLLLAALLEGCGSSVPGAPKSSLQGKLHLLQVPAPYSLPGQIVLGPDGNLWFPAVASQNFGTSKPGGAIGQLTPGGTFHLFPLPGANMYPLNIAFAKNGNLWFSAFQGNGKLRPIGDTAPAFTGGYGVLGQMAQNGAFHLFNLPSPAINPGSIAIGSDNNLWFTDVRNGTGNVLNYIGRITPSGEVSEFPITLRQANDFIKLLIAGPDGNLWFSIDSSLADYSAYGEMGRMTPRGAVTIFPLGKFLLPRDMTIGPDGNLWISSGASIERLTMQGQLRVFYPGGQAQKLSQIAIGGITSNRDGALWFATQNVALGRVTTDGVFSYYPFPENTTFDNGGSSLDMNNLRGIAAGKDGTLWLTNDDRIGHMV